MMVGYVSPEAAAGGPIARLRNGDRIRIDAAKGTLKVLADLSKRRAKAPLLRVSGVLEKYATLVGPANLGAVTHSGARKR
jgi:dihydroxy-acid dehydratase